MPWTPPPRAPWAEKMVALGHGLGDDGRSLVPLDSDDLLDAARRVTGLEDAGDDWFLEPLRRLCASLDDEAELHLPGRIRARGELQLILQNRLRLVDLWRRHPELADEPVAAPVIVTGLGRSGTTFLHELLWLDPANRAPLLWELLHTPVDAPSGGAGRSSGWSRSASPGSPGSPGRPGGPDGEDPRIDLTDREIKLMDELVPAFTAMHENGGGLPTECIFIFAHQFSTDMFTGLYNVPSYTIWRSGLNQAPIYEWHRRMLQTLQGLDDRPSPRWVVKAPSHLSSLDLVFATYPDARVVMTHRDPLRVVGSLADLMATLHWMHSERVDHQVLVEFLCAGVEVQMNGVAAERSSGRLPEEQIHDVLYRDLVADPRRVVADLYAQWGLEISPEYDAALNAYLAARHEGRTSGHDYSFADTGLDLDRHRALVAGYQERFGVPSEV